MYLLVASKCQHSVTANLLSSETKRKKWEIESRKKKKESKFNKNYFATDLHEILLRTRWGSLSSFLAKIFFNNRLANERSDNIQITDPNSSIYVYIASSRFFSTNGRDSAWKFTLRSTADSVFSFRRADRRTARNSANLSAADHRVSSRSKHASSCDQHARASLLFTHKSTAWNYITFPSKPTTNLLFFHREGIPRIFGLSQIDLSPTMIFFFKDVMIGGQWGRIRNFVKGEIVVRGYGRNIWMDHWNWRDVV